ncbi:MAG TPA: hypothetical protein VI229_05655 [Burkholderiales bacterium]
MSQILNRLKQAEEERQRVIAERKRLETEADAALAEREREEMVRAQQGAERPVAPPQAPPPAQTVAETPQQRSRFAAALAIGVAMAVVFWVGTLVPQKPEIVVQATAPVQAVATPAPAAKAPPPELFRMDGDLDAFALRLKDKP